MLPDTETSKSGHFSVLKTSCQPCAATKTTSEGGGYRVPMGLATNF